MKANQNSHNSAVQLEAVAVRWVIPAADPALLVTQLEGRNSRSLRRAGQYQNRVVFPVTKLVDRRNPVLGSSMEPMVVIGISGGGGREHNVHCLHCLERKISLGCNKFCTKKLVYKCVVC